MTRIHSRLVSQCIGSSVNGLPIMNYLLEPPSGGQSIPPPDGGPSLSEPARVLVLGGVHGDEVEGVQLAWSILHELIENEPMRPQARVSIIPQFNIDGVLKNTRQNAHGVDLNRNLPTRDWNPAALEPKYQPGPRANSEPENQALVAWIKDFKPHVIYSLHSWKPMVNVNGPCDPEATFLAQATGTPVEESVGYPTPGSLGTYAGHELKIPTLTIEIARGLEPRNIKATYLIPMLDSLRLSAGSRGNGINQ